MTGAKFYYTTQATYSQSQKAGSLCRQKRQGVKLLYVKRNQSVKVSINVCERQLITAAVIIVYWVNSAQEEQRQQIQSVYVCCVFQLELIINKVMEYISLAEGTATHRAGYPACAV